MYGAKVRTFCAEVSLPATVYYALATVLQNSLGLNKPISEVTNCLPIVCRLSAIVSVTKLVDPYWGCPWQLLPLQYVAH